MHVCVYVWKIKGNPGHRGGQQCDSKALLATEPRNVLRPWARGSRLPWNNPTRVNIGPAGQRLNACRSQDRGGLQPDTEEGSQRLELCCYIFVHVCVCVPAFCSVLLCHPGSLFSIVQHTRRCSAFLFCLDVPSLKTLRSVLLLVPTTLIPTFTAIIQCGNKSKMLHVCFINKPHDM